MGVDEVGKPRPDPISQGGGESKNFLWPADNGDLPVTTLGPRPHWHLSCSIARQALLGSLRKWEGSRAVLLQHCSHASIGNMFNKDFVCWFEPHRQ